MFRIAFTFPPKTHVRDGLDLATDDFLVGRTITFRGEVTWTAGTAVGLDGFPFQGLIVTAHESRYYDGVDSDWVEVRDEPVPRVTLANPTVAAFDHDLTPLDAMARYKVKVLALGRDGEVLAASDSLIVRSVLTGTE